MKRFIIFFCTVMLVVGVAGHVSAALYSGSITPGDGMTANGEWGTGSEFHWEVDYIDSENSWLYTYFLGVQSKDISHGIIEVSENFTESDINSSSGGSLGNYTSTDQGASNPGMPDPGMYGIKGEGGNWTPTSYGDEDYPFPEDAYQLAWTWFIETNRMPMWGDFYAKDGVTLSGDNDLPDSNWNYAYNTNFGTDPSPETEIADGNAGGWVLVPDTQTTPVPEPTTMLLLGTGLIGIVGIAGVRRRFKK